MDEGGLGGGAMWPEMTRTGALNATEVLPTKGGRISETAPQKKKDGRCWMLGEDG